ncbi:tight adherence pilus pseudopilin TadF [Vibrio mimicus]|nr:pilus assembly protein TadF [Vibrio mimicus CAIM 1882]ERM53183.1 pilus assembly protein TadF [Vibrio mimicus CAIM 1883]
MQVNVSPKRQRGAFMVELALVMVVFSALFAILINYSIAINKKGQLDRVAYSLTTILAERKQLFGSQFNVCNYGTSDCDRKINDLYALAASSMRRMLPTFDESQFGLRIEQVSIDVEDLPDGKVNYKKRYNKLEKGNVAKCAMGNAQSMSKQEAIDLLPITSRKRRLPLYQVSVCYSTPFNILGIGSGDVTHIVATSYSFARV